MQETAPLLHPASPPASPLLSASDLACRRGDRILFKGLNLALKPGDLLHVQGANGIGKSSLLRILAGLLTPYAGVIVRNGAVALADERLALDPHLPLGKALGFWLAIDGAPPNAIDFDLARLADVPVRYLSTGQRKRATLARAMRQNAPILLLDEPLNGLDATFGLMATQWMHHHCKDGGIAVVASHQRLEDLNISGVNRSAIALEDYAL